MKLKKLLNEIVGHYGFKILYAYLNINCFKTNPSIESSIKFLKKTDWAREKVESFYLYQFKNLPRASSEQFLLSPRDRIIPDDQVLGEPAELSLEDAERLQEKRERKSAERGQGRQRAFSKGYGRQSGHSRDRDSDSKSSENGAGKGKIDPWANWKNKSKT